MIDKRAVIHPDAKIADNVEIGPFSVIGPHVEIGEGTWVGPHVVITGHTTVGRNNKIYQFSSIGETPQDKKYADEETYTRIGDDNVIRECVTIHRGTVQDEGITIIGNDVLLMAYTHIAHDCVLGDHIILANSCGIAGHVKIDDYVIMSGFCGAHQFCQIGAHSFISHASTVSKDVPPYVMITGGTDVTVCGINVEGLKRRGFSPEAIAELRRAYKVIYRQGLRIAEAKEKLVQMQENCSEVGLLTEFLERSTRGIVR